MTQEKPRKKGVQDPIDKEIVLILIFACATVIAFTLIQQAWGVAVSLNQPEGVATDATDRIIIANTGRNEIIILSKDNEFIKRFGSYGTGNGQFNRPVGVITDPQGNIYVADYGNSRVQVFDNTGNYLRQFGTGYGATGAFHSPKGIDVDSSNNIYVVGQDNNRITKLNSTGYPIVSWGGKGDTNGKFYSPTALKVDNDNNVYVIDYGNHRIQKFDTNGNFLLTYGISGTGAYKFSSPTQLETDSNNNVFISDKGCGCIYKYDENGVFITSFIIDFHAVPFGLAEGYVLESPTPKFSIFGDASNGNGNIEYKTILFNVTNPDSSPAYGKINAFFYAGVYPWAYPISTNCSSRTTLDTLVTNFQSGDNIIIAPMKFAEPTDYGTTTVTTYLYKGATLLAQNQFNIDMGGGGQTGNGYTLLYKDVGASANPTYTLEVCGTHQEIKAAGDIYAINGFTYTAFTDSSSVALGTSDTTIATQTTSFAAGNNIVIASIQIDNGGTAQDVAVSGLKIKNNGGTTIASNQFTMSLGTGIPTDKQNILLIGIDDGAGANSTYTVTGKTPNASNGEAKVLVFQPKNYWYQDTGSIDVSQDENQYTTFNFTNPTTPSTLGVVSAMQYDHTSSGFNVWGFEQMWSNPKLFTTTIEYLYGQANTGSGTAGDGMRHAFVGQETFRNFNESIWTTTGECFTYCTRSFSNDGYWNGDYKMFSDGSYVGFGETPKVDSYGNFYFLSGIDIFTPTLYINKANLNGTAIFPLYSYPIGNVDGDVGFDPTGNPYVLHLYFTIDNDNNYLITEPFYNRISKFSGNDGTFIESFKSIGHDVGELIHPRGIDIDSNGNIYVTDYGGDKVNKYANDGTALLSYYYCWDNPIIICDPNSNFILSVSNIALVEDWDMMILGDYQDLSYSGWTSASGYWLANGTLNDVEPVGAGDGFDYRDGIYMQFESNSPYDTNLLKTTLGGETLGFYPPNYQGYVHCGIREFGVNPRDIAIDSRGRAIIADTDCSRVLVMSNNFGSFEFIIPFYDTTGAGGSSITNTAVQCNSQASQARNANFTQLQVNVTRDPFPFDINVAYRIGLLTNPTWINQTNVNNYSETIAVNPQKTVYTTFFIEGNQCGNLISYGNSTGITSLIDFTTGMGTFFGVPVPFIFVILFAAIWTGVSAPMGSIALAGVIGIMGFIGLLPDPVTGNNLITGAFWTGIILLTAFGAFLGKRYK